MESPTTTSTATTNNQPINARASMHSHSQHPKRASTRLSTYSVTPTLAPSIAPSHLSTAPSLTPSEKGDPLARDMHAVRATLARLEEPRLANQRYVVSENKKDEFGALALGAKLEKALARRMSAQDASFRTPASSDNSKKESNVDEKGIVRPTVA